MFLSLCSFLNSNAEAKQAFPSELGKLLVKHLEKLLGKVVAFLATASISSKLIGPIREQILGQFYVNNENANTN